MCTNIIYQALIEFITYDVLCLRVLAASVVHDLDGLGLPLAIGRRVLSGSLLALGRDFGRLLAFGSDLGHDVLDGCALVVMASEFLGLANEGSGAGSFGVVLAHDVAVVADDAARSVPGLVDAGALDGADVEVGLAIDTADGLVLGVARAVLVDDNLARLFSGD